MKQIQNGLTLELCLMTIKQGMMKGVATLATTSPVWEFYWLIYLVLQLQLFHSVFLVREI